MNIKQLLLTAVITTTYIFSTNLAWIIHEEKTKSKKSEMKIKIDSV